MVLHHLQKIIQNSQVVKKRLDLKNNEIILVMAFLVHYSRTKILPDMSSAQNDSPEQYLKNKLSEKSNNKTFEKT